MSKFGFCVKGGEDGIQVTTQELVAFAKNTGREFIDEFIPLPNVSVEEQLKRIENCKCDSDEETYWERENGKHGWCCPNCGTVVQWG